MEKIKKNKYIDISGQRFGRLIAVCQIETHLNPKSQWKTLWLCKCDCGKEKNICFASLKRGLTKSCGCLRNRPCFTDLTGKRFNRLTVIKLVETPKHIKHQTDKYWLCKCDCGNETIVVSGNLKNNHTRSCGCYNIEKTKQSCMTHGRTRTKEFQAWNHMIQRCYNSNDNRFYTYGARGITVCDKWKNSFQAFLDDVGIAPGQKYSIDRINNDGNYDPGNVKWSTVKEQARKKTVTRYIEYNGYKKPLVDVAKDNNIQYKTLLYRINNGWTIEEALTIPVKKQSYQLAKSNNNKEFSYRKKL